MARDDAAPDVPVHRRPTRSPLTKECLGFYGYGSGYFEFNREIAIALTATEGQRHGLVGYCERCPVRRDCTDRTWPMTNREQHGEVPRIAPTMRRNADYGRSAFLATVDISSEHVAEVLRISRRVF